MKLISLNIWGGRFFEPLMNFIKKYSKDVDIFCFQEVRNGKLTYGVIDPKENENIFNELKEALVDFNAYYSEQISGVGSAVFVRKNIKVKDAKREVLLFFKELEHLKRKDGYSYYPRIMQMVDINGLTVYNFHGIPGGKKGDTKERDLQQNRLKNILNNDKNSKILVGDFNIDINTKYIFELGKTMKDLIKEYKIKTTRNHFYEKLNNLPFSDYVFVSKDIEVLNFEVLQDEISDHLPILLEFR